MENFQKLIENSRPTALRRGVIARKAREMAATALEPKGDAKYGNYMIITHGKPLADTSLDRTVFTTRAAWSLEKTDDRHYIIRAPYPEEGRLVRDKMKRSRRRNVLDMDRSDDMFVFVNRSAVDDVTVKDAYPRPMKEGYTLEISFNEYGTDNHRFFRFYREDKWVAPDVTDYQNEYFWVIQNNDKLAEKEFVVSLLKAGMKKALKVVNNTVLLRCKWIEHLRTR